MRGKSVIWPPAVGDVFGGHALGEQLIGMEIETTVKGECAQGLVPRAYGDAAGVRQSDRGTTETVVIEVGLQEVTINGEDATIEHGMPEVPMNLWYRVVTDIHGFVRERGVNGSKGLGKVVLGGIVASAYSSWEMVEVPGGAKARDLASGFGSGKGFGEEGVDVFSASEQGW